LFSDKDRHGMPCRPGDQGARYSVCVSRLQAP